MNNQECFSFSLRLDAVFFFKKGHKVKGKRESQ